MVKDIGNRIAEIRRDRGLSQDELAELATLSRISIARYETGKIEPGAQALGRIAEALEVPTDVLLGRFEEEKKEITENDMIRERMRRDPNYRMLFDAAENASTMCEALRAFLEELQAGERLKQYAARSLQSGDKKEAAETAVTNNARGPKK